MTNEMLLAQARLHLTRDEAVPLTLLAEADQRGLMLTEFGQPNTPYQEGDYDYGFTAKEELYDATDHTGLCVFDYPGHCL